MNSPCPLCHHKDYRTVYAQVAFFPDAEVVACRYCGHFYTVLHTEIDKSGLYADEVYQVVENRDSVYDRIMNLEYGAVLGMLGRLRPNKGWLLDFGSGKGKFGALARAAGWQVRCVETSEPRAAYARSVYGLEVNSEFFAGGSIFGVPFEVLTLFHVLEHLPEPAELLAALFRENLREDGLAVIEVPNFSSWQSKIARRKWLHLDASRHIHHFTPDRLRRFLRELGLEPVRTSYWSWHLGLLGMVDSLLRLFGYRGNIIVQLKNGKNAALLLKIGLLLPFALVLELLAAGLRRGGIVRIYLRRQSKS
jgi:2-polyprenyl-3-methyl-5-hydroxy-6-metoxy-1,4-benzoquinol methylase